MDQKKGKVLFTASTDLHLINFHVPHINYLVSQGYEVHVACKGSRRVSGATKQFEVCFDRNPVRLRNFYAFKQLVSIFKEFGYELVHCHTPVCSAITRVASMKFRKKGMSVLYTAHGFHFYKGSPLINWLVYFPLEVALSAMTDGIVAINREDFRRLNTSWFKNKHSFYIDGIGVDSTGKARKYKNFSDYRQSLGIANDEIVILYIAEFIPRKNHQVLFKILPNVLKTKRKVRVLFAGGFSVTKERLELKAISDGIQDNLLFLGYVEKIEDVIAIADIGLSVSKAEGLPIGVLELMSFGIPVIASAIRGHVDIIEDGKNGLLFDLNNPSELERKLNILIESDQLRSKIGKVGERSISKFSVIKSVRSMAIVYSNFLKGLSIPEG